MKLGQSKSGLTVFIHLMVWALLGFILLFYPPLTWDIKTPVSFWIKQSVNIFIMAAVFYFNALYMVPKFLFLDKITVFVTWLLLALVSVMVLSRIIELQLHVMEDMVALNNFKKTWSKYNFDLHLFTIMLLVLVISTGLAAAQRWQEREKMHELMEKQQIVSELASLKAQINPHFFFNTLNNIYSLTYSDIPLSREALLKLSRMMRYVLYDTLQEKVLLSQEISFINDYIDLMKLRLHQQTTLEFEHPKTDREYYVAPMLLLPFIENAFKHGSSSLDKSRIIIDLAASKNVVALKVFNNIQQDKPAQNLESGGIGLVNTKRRLDLLYPERHNLSIRESRTDETYSVDLQINTVPLSK